MLKLQQRAQWARLRPSCLHHRHVQNRSGLRLAQPLAKASKDNVVTTMSTIDDLLGSRDEEEAPVVQQQGPLQLLRVPGWAWAEIQEPRVVPLASNVLYYLLLIVYTSYYVVQLAQGQEVADDLLARMVNDHAAVASGDTLRLFTSFFVADTLPQLIIALIALATVAAELESLIGYSTFWALWCVTVLTGSFADAALSGMPITAGPAAGVGGAAAALLAHHLHNWRVEELLAQAKSGEIPEPLMQLEHQYNRQQRLKLLQAQAAAGADAADASADAPSSSSSSSSSSGAEAAAVSNCQQQQQQSDAAEERWLGTLTADETLVETEIEGPVGLSLTLLLPREGKAFITLGGTAVAVISALKDAADTDVATDWTALAAGFAAGAVLGWLACPVYAVELVPESSSSGSGEGEQQQPDMLLPVLHDVRPLAERANAVVGFAAVLFALLGVWLASEGLFE